MSGASVHSLLPRYPLTAITNSPSGPVDFPLKGEHSQGYLSGRTDPCGGNGKLHIGGQLMPGVHNWQQGPAGLGKPGSRQNPFDPKAAHLPSSPRSSSVVSGNSTQTQQYAQGPPAPPPRPTYSQLTQSYSRAELPQQTEAWSSFQSPLPSLSNMPSLTDHTGCLPLPPLPPIRTSLPEPYPTAPTFAKRQRVDNPPTMFLQQPLNLQMQRALLNAQQHVQRVNEVLNWVPRWVPPPPDDSEDDEDLLISGPEFMRAEVNIWRGSC